MMVFGLGKLFGKKDKADADRQPGSDPAATLPPRPAAANAPAAASAPATSTASAFVRREAVFDRGRRLIGHLFSLQHANSRLGEAPTRHRRALDDILLTSLAASARDEGWGNTLAFVPLCSAALDNPRLDHLPASNTVLLIALSPENTDPAPLAERLAALEERGFSLGIFRQPGHPAFAAVLALADYAAIDVAASQGGNIRDFSVAVRSNEVKHRVSLLATNIEAKDDYNLCHLWHFDFFQGPFVTTGEAAEAGKGDPHKLHLLRLLNLVQGDAETTEIAAALKQDPLLTYRILRYLNSAAIGLSRPIQAIDQALVMLGRQRLARWLSVLLFSVKNPDFADWLLVETSLGRGRIMELLGTQRLPAAEADHLFLTGVFSRLDRLLRIPLEEALQQMPLPTNVRSALLNRSGPYAPLLAVAEACEAFDPERIEAAARAAGLDPDTVNRALLAATAWTSEITEHWE